MAKLPKDVLSEAEDYLKATDAVSRPVAVIITLIAITVIAALVFTLFLGGRWIYRQFKDEDSAVSVQTDGEQTDTTTQTPPTTVSPSSDTPPQSSPTPEIPRSTTLPNTGPINGYAILGSIAGAGYVVHLAATKFRIRQQEPSPNTKK